MTTHMGSCRFTGSIIASGAVRGSLNLSGNATWLLPVWMQLLCSVIIAALTLLLPESPRWLFVNGEKDRAKDLLAELHGKGSVESVWVELQLREYGQVLRLDGTVGRTLCYLQSQLYFPPLGQAMVGLPCPIPKSSITLSSRLQHDSQRFWPMDWQRSGGSTSQCCT